MHVLVLNTHLNRPIPLLDLGGVRLLNIESYPEPPRIELLPLSPRRPPPNVGGNGIGSRLPIGIPPVFNNQHQ